MILKDLPFNIAIVLVAAGSIFVMSDYKVIKEFIEQHKDNSIIFDLAIKMFEEGKTPPELILTHVIIYQFNQLKTQELILQPLKEAA